MMASSKRYTVATLLFLSIWIDTWLPGSVAAAGTETETCTTFGTPGEVEFEFSRTYRPYPKELIPENAVIGQIQITRLSIFNPRDPEENRWLHRAANYMHIVTSEEAIREQLLFDTGDTFERQAMDESARILRDKPYLYDARIWPYRICGQRVDIEVVTRDVWTLTPGISFSRSGGVNSSDFLFRDSNLFGTGKELVFGRSSSTDRSGVEFQYNDRNLFGTHRTLNLFYADNDDGSRTVFEAAQPFYSLSSRWALGVRAEEDKRTDTLYERSEEIAEFRLRKQDYELFAGFSRGLRRGSTRRWFWGARWLREAFEPEPGETPPRELPLDRRINYPWIGYESIEDRFIRTNNLNHIYRTEDINMGKRWSWRLGWADTAWHSDSDRLVYGASYSEAWQLSEDSLLLTDLSLNGFWREEDNATEELVLENRWRFYHSSSTHTSWFAGLEWSYARNLPANRQLLMGGENDLRGYPLRYQEGDRRFLLTVERRYYTDWYLYRILRFGGAVFIDVGRSWFPGDELSGATGVLANAGFGLRIASTRAESGRVLHVDVAFPFEDEHDVDDMQLIITAKQHF